LGVLRPGAALLLFSGLALLGVSVTPCALQEVPANDGWVTDLADMLTPEQERSLEALMESYKSGSGHEMALLTVPDLGGRTIEELALNVGRSWNIGREGEHDGALLLVARDERELRIEVGRGLEGTLVDSLCARIIRDVIVPEFKQGRHYEGMRKGIEAMHAVAGGDYGPIEETPSGRRERGSGAGWIVVLVIMILLARRGRGGRGRNRSGGSSVLPWILASQLGNIGRSSSGGFGGFSGRSSGGGFRGFGGGGGFSGGGASGRW